MNPDLKKALQSLPGYDPFDTEKDCWYFDEKTAWHSVDFLQKYATHVKGALARKPLELSEFQVVTQLNLYGWRHKDTGRRRYRQAFILVPRKNGKSTWIAGLCLYAQAADPLRDLGGELYCAATEREQAALVFDQAKNMVLQNEELNSLYKIYQRSLVIEDDASSLKPISADAKSKHGFNSSFICYDEIHSAKDRDLYDVLDTSTGSRENPLIIVITTSDFNRPSICNELQDRAEKVQQGIIKDDSLLPVIFKAEITDDWTDPEVWAKANPNLGISVSLDYMKQKCQKAQDTPSFENTFKRLHLNIKTEQAVRWLQMDKWDMGSVPLQELAGRRCYAGLDLSTTTDITALVLVFEDDEGGFDVLPYFWCPLETAREKEKRDGVPYMQWIHDGFMEGTEGNVIDYDELRKRINEIVQDYPIEEIGYDPWNATQLANQLFEQDGIPMIQFRQGFISMNEPSKALEALVIGGSLRHANNPVLRWMASNASVKSDPAGNIKPAKDKSTGRIDGIVALIMAIGRATATAGEGLSGYEDDVPIEIHI